MPRLLTDISSTPSQRCFIVAGDDHRFSITINGEQASWLPGDVEATWTPDLKISNNSLADLLIGLAAELKAQPHGYHLDERKPIV
jgi:hypothetical protein